MSVKIFEEINVLKDALLELENMTKMELEKREDNIIKLESIDNKIEKILSQNSDMIVYINVGGKVFNVYLSVLLSVKDTIFYYLLLDNEKLLFNSKEKPLFIDRDYTHFPIILEYLKFKNIQLKEISLKSEYIEEFKFYNIPNLFQKKEKLTNKIDFTFAVDKNSIATCSVETLKIGVPGQGVACGSGGSIIFTFNGLYNVDRINFNGISNHSSISSSAGKRSHIYSSQDNINWIKVGRVPKNYNAIVCMTTLTTNMSKYIKFTCEDGIGIGFIEFVDKS